MTKYYLAIDFGASSGRHILASIQDGKLVLEEVYRFKNGIERINGHLCWNLERLFEEIKNGLKKCKEINKIPYSMGIDTWGVDFVLLDKDDKVIGDAVSYRDTRTEGMEAAVEDIISDTELYSRTGLRKQSYNSIYQLMAIKKQTPEYFDKAETFLMLAPYFNFLLTGQKKTEYTNATTTGLINAQTKTWDKELINRLGFKESIFNDVHMPKTVVDGFLPEIRDEVGFDCKVVLPATHDTASAVLALPTTEDTIYISSGTWSLMGIERECADCSEKSRELELSNEGGFDGRFRCLQNIMGLWIIQSIKRNLNDRYSFGELSEKARKYKDFPSEINVNDSRFMAPENMIDTIREYCRETKQKEPLKVGEIMQCAYSGLAKCYNETVTAIESLQGKKYDSIAIIGGGCQDMYLNELTAKITGKSVCSGPVEATAIGNVLAQLMADSVVETIEEARELVRKSFKIQQI